MLVRPLWILFLGGRSLARGRLADGLDDGLGLVQLSGCQAQGLPLNFSGLPQRRRPGGGGDLSGLGLEPARRRAEAEPRGRQRHNFGSLVNETLLRRELSSAREPAAKEVRDRLLVFWPVGGRKATRDLVVANINHLQRFQEAGLPRPLRVDNFLVHYDGRRDAWREAVGLSWYDAHVRYSLEYQALKIWMAKDILLSKLNGSSPELNSYGFDLSSYEYLWMVDEDADFNRVDLRLMIDLARESGSGILTPAFTTTRGLQAMRQSGEAGETARTGRIGEVGGIGESGGSDFRGESRSADGGLVRCQYNDSVCDFQKPKSQCRFRYVNFVEVSFALVKPAVFRAVVEGCPGCLPERQSTWGVDRVWCSVADWDSQGPRRSCAVLDATPIVHQNQRTLPGYRDGAAHQDYLGACLRAARKVRRSLPSLWRDMPEAIECIPAGGGKPR